VARRDDKYQNVEEEAYDNYKPVQGIMTPYTLPAITTETSSPSVSQQGKVQRRLADSLFEARAKPASN